MENLSWRSVDVSLERPIDYQELNGVYAKFGKRLFDIVFALLLFPVVLPVTGLLWALIKCDGGPGFFGHVRIGQNGKAFKCWKIRSMVVDAEKKLKAYLEQNPDAAAEWAKDFKLEKDPRITQLGRFLRKSSLDELPQIWNVLKGEMSFVGPRPIIEAELVKYGGYQWAYLAATPGVTGVWQVSGRNDVSYDERVRMDAEYLEKRSFLFDCAIMLKTVSAVLNRTGK